MRERLMTATNAFRDETGHLCVRDADGLVRWTSNPRDRPQEIPGSGRPGFDINLDRLGNLNRLIEHRHGGPVDTDDGAAYLSVALNAIAMSRRIRGWRQARKPLIAWARKWTPLVATSDVELLVAKVMSAPRRMTSRSAGRLVRVTLEEWTHLGLRALDPTDIPRDQVARAKVDRKRARDRETASIRHRSRGARPIAEIKAASLKAFCQRNGLSERTFRYNAARGGKNLSKWLEKKGVSEKLPQGVAILEGDSSLMLRQGAATFAEGAAPARARGAAEPVIRIPANPTRKLTMARLFTVAADIFALPAHSLPSGRKHLPQQHPHFSSSDDAPGSRDASHARVSSPRAIATRGGTPNPSSKEHRR